MVEGDDVFRAAERPFFPENAAPRSVRTEDAAPEVKRNFPLIARQTNSAGGV